jgi:hypothetical protein
MKRESAVVNAPSSRLVYGLAGCYGNVVTGEARQSAEVEAALLESELLVELELSELLDELSLLELESEPEPVLDSDVELAPLPPSSTFALESFLSLKSVSYHPLPFSRKLGADSIFFKAALSHCGQSFRGSSENF